MPERKELPQHYAKAVRTAMFDGVDVCPVLPYDRPPAKARLTGQGVQRSFSFSGAQDKYSMVLDAEHKVLRYREEGEQGGYILKPCPTDAYMPHRKDAPANEELCMDIVRRLFRQPAAACALCYFGNGEAAYLTRRFDRVAGEENLHMEDFAAILGMQGGSSGRKYSYSYEALATAIRETSTAPAADVLRFFRMVLINYLLCNGDAHLKNFALLGQTGGSMVLSPAYDIMNTRLHVQDADFAMEKGLFEDGHPAPDGNIASYFRDWAECIGVSPRAAMAFLRAAADKQPRIEEMVAQSALSRKAQKAFLLTTRQRFKALRAGLNQAG